MRGFCLILFSFIIIISSCKKDEISYDVSNKLDFSQESVVFDTVFTTIGSVTKYIKIYNRNNKKLIISNINLSGGKNSNFKVNIDGTPGCSFENIEIYPNDSLFVLVEVTVDPNNSNSPLVIMDSIMFSTNGNNQKVKLVAWGQDANYIIANQYVGNLPYKVVAHENESVVWNNTKPYVIYGYAVVDSAAELHIGAGTKIYFHKNSGLWVYKYGMLKVNGTLEEPVIFQGDRLDYDYRNIAGQWDRIWINESNKTSEIKYAIIKNGFIGIQAESLENRIDNQKLIIKNTIIQNMSGIGLLSKNYAVSGYNLMVSNCGQYCVALTMGGKYNFKNCTFANYWESTRNTPAFYLNNYVKVDNTTYTYPLDEANIENSIIYGNLENEIEISSNGGTFNYFIESCILKTGPDSDINTSNTTYFKNTIKNPSNIEIDGASRNPIFNDYGNNDFSLFNQSVAKDKANIDLLEINTYRDLKGNLRITAPDLGAIEFIE